MYYLTTTFAEVGGGGGIFSLNYDNRFHRNWSFRAGVGYMNWYEYTGSLGMYQYAFDNGSCCEQTNFNGSISIPLMINFMTNDGINPGHFEVGLGITPWFGNTITSVLVRTVDSQGRPNGTKYNILYNGLGISAFLPVNVGYRYQPLDGGFFFRIGAHGLFGGNFGFLPWLGISAGHTFD